MVVDTIQSLLRERPEIRQEEIAVITPWREQVWRTRARLRQVGLRGVDVGNVEVGF
jgi:superfamily I DNA and/or RNA helicase